jgi:hypothetical protein
MSHTDLSRENESNAGKAGQEPVSREQLYELVWSEPMLRVGERFGVSSSYMARVCADLRVPRPARGYWAQRELGKSLPKRPPLPGDVTVWRPGASLSQPRSARLRPTDASVGNSESGPNGEGGHAIRQPRKPANKLNRSQVRQTWLPVTSC